MLELLKQGRHINITWPEQAVLFYAVEEGFFDDVEKNQWSSFETFLLELVRNRYPNVLKKIKDGIFNQEVKKKIQEIAKDFKQEFISD